MPCDDRMKDFLARRERARAMGGADRIARRRDAGRLNARERIERLVDADSFLERLMRTRTAIGKHHLANFPTKF